MTGSQALADEAHQALRRARPIRGSAFYRHPL